MIETKNKYCTIQKRDRYHFLMDPEGNEIPMQRRLTLISNDGEIDRAKCVVVCDERREGSVDKDYAKSLPGYVSSRFIEGEFISGGMKDFSILVFTVELK